jgi:hypothetical protein
LPTRDLLQAALLIEIADQTQLGKELAPWRSIAGEHLKLHAGSAAVAAHLVTCRPEDRAIGTAHWVQFHLPPDVRNSLANFSQRAFLSFEIEAYRHKSPVLSDDFRQSLLDDLLLSDKDGEKLAG